MLSWLNLMGDCDLKRNKREKIQVVCSKFMSKNKTILMPFYIIILQLYF